MQLNLKLNASVAFAEQIVVGLSYFSIYSFAIRRIGPSEVGIWSVALAALSVLQLADLKLGNSLLHYIARFEAEGARTASIAYYETAALVATAFSALVCSVSLVPYAWFASRWLPPENADRVVDLLPFVFATSLVTTAAAIPLATLGAFGRSFIRSGIGIIAAMANAGLACVLTASLGIQALAWAQVVQSVTLLILGVASVKFIVPEAHLLPRKLDHVVARRIVRYGSSLQVMSLCLFMVEPFTRLLIGRYGTLSDVTYFSIAYRLILAVRNLVFNSVLTLVPAFSAMTVASSKRSDEVYNRLNSAMTLIAGPCMAAAVCAAPWISHGVFGEQPPTFFWCCVVLAAATVVDLIATGPLLRALGEGLLKWNILTHITYAVVNGLLGFVLAIAWGTVGAAVAMGVATVIGGLVQIVGAHRMFGGRIVGFVKGCDLVVISASAAACVIAVEVHQELSPSLGELAAFFLAGAIAGPIVGGAIWHHPGCTQVWRFITK